MYRFPKIRSWQHVTHYAKSREGSLDVDPLGVVEYRGTVKLHGTNAGVKCTADQLVPQSRV